MDKVYISTLTLLFGTLIIGGLGALLGWYWKKRTEGTWKADFIAIEKENKKLEKRAKKSETANNKLKQQVENWKEKATALEEKYKRQVADLEAQEKEDQATILEQKAAIKKLTSANKQASYDFERLNKSYLNLKEKYKEDMVDLKEGRTNRDKYNRAMKDARGQLKVANEKIASLTTSNAKLTKEVEENSVFISKLRALKARNKKLTEDLKYWEKKHYDTHHELAGIQDRIAEVEAKNQELELQRSTATQDNEQMLQKMQEFKTKFVNINDKYHRMMESQRN